MSHAPSLVDPHGRRITPRDVHRGMRLNIVAGSLGMIWAAMALGMPLPMFMQAIGASGVLIGAMTTVRLLAMSMQIPAALLLEHASSRKKSWFIFAVLHRLAWFVLAALAWWGKPGETWLPFAAIAAVAVSDILASIGAASWFSWMADLVPTRTSARFWGIRQSIVTAASLMGVAAAGWILDRFRQNGSGDVDLHGFGLVFAIAATLGVADIVVHYFVKEPKGGPPVKHASTFQRILAPMRNRNFRQLTLAFGAWNFGAAMIGSFGVIYLEREFHVSYSNIAITAIAGSVGSVSMSYFFGHLIDRMGARVMGGILLLVAPLTILPWFFITNGQVALGGLVLPQPILVVALGSVIGGGFFGAIALCQLRLLGTLSESTGRTMSMAVHWSIIGLVAALGPMLGGLVMDWVDAHPLSFTIPTGLPFSFYHVQAVLFVLLVWAVALPLMLSIRTPAAETPFGAALWRLVPVNPLQAVRNFYNVQVISGPTTSHKRAQAVRSLGMNRSSLAVPDLIQKMEDPSMEVQEEAVEALGSIGTAEAVDALMHKLSDPSTDLAPQVCRALRHAADPRAGEILISRLSGTDRETLCESVRALGAIGDRRAIPHLLDLMKNTRMNKVLAACSEALAALGELSAAWLIIPQMRTTSNRVLKRALTVAAGDLLGEREVFYKLLISETETPGSATAALLRDLARSVRKAFPKAERQHETIERLEPACHDRQIEECAVMLLHLGLHLIQFIHRLPISLDPNAVMQKLLERDHRAAVGIWYLKMLNEPWEIDGKDQRDMGDILLGLHAVANIVESRPASETLKHDHAGSGTAV